MAFVMDNVVGTCTMLEFARKSGCKAFVYFSTDEVFGPAAEGQAFKEWDRYKSGNPYAATKAGGEELALAYHNTYGVPVIITHTMNVVGRRQHWEKFVPSTIGKVLKGEIVTIHASPDMKTPGSRFYISADSVAEALVRISETGEEAGQKFNIVGAEEINNLDMARRIAAAMRKELRYELVDFHSSRPGHDLRYALDGQLLRDKLGFAPKLDIKPVVDWYLHNPSWLAPGCKEMLT
jgi:dTDP-glucose 4,6-dehydratase